MLGSAGCHREWEESATSQPARAAATSLYQVCELSARREEPRAERSPRGERGSGGQARDLPHSPLPTPTAGPRPQRLRVGPAMHHDSHALRVYSVSCTVWLGFVVHVRVGRGPAGAALGGHGKRNRVCAHTVESAQMSKFDTV